MRRAFLAPCFVASAALASCGNEPPAQNQVAGDNQPEQNQTATLDPADMPAPIVRSPSYRCDDGNALYVDVLQEKEAVLVRDTSGCSHAARSRRRLGPLYRRRL